ncbi:MAG: response regulator [Planctomycetota bacterium]
MRVLIVDDSEMVRVTLEAMVKRLGHEPLPAEDGAAALAASGYDVVLLDLELPDVTGAEVAAALRARGASVPIYGISGHADAAERCREAGMDGSFMKPFRLPDIAALLGVASAHAALGDAGLVRTMLEGLVAEAPRLLAEARCANDPVEMRRLAHTLRGTLRFIDAPEAERAAADLETAAAEGSIDSAALDALGRSLDELMPRIAKLLE